MTRLFNIGYLLLFSIFLVSCVRLQEIENIGIINALGVDSTEEDSLETSLVTFQFSTQSNKLTHLFTGRGQTIDGAIEDAESSTVSRLVPGKIKLIQIGEDLAKQGILPLLDSQTRDPRVPDMLYLSVGRPTAKEILSVDENDLSMDVGQYLFRIIESHSTDHNIPRKSLQDFLRIYYDVGQDNIMPIFEIKEKVPKQIGAALFKGDQMIGELTNRDIMYINLMDRTVRDKMLELTLPIEPFQDHLAKREQPHHRNDLEVALLIDKGRSKTKLVDSEKLVFETNTTIKLLLFEQSAGVKLDEPGVIKTFETEISKKMEEHFNKLLKKLKEYESDPFGYGRYYKRTQTGSNMTEEEWREKYPNIEVKFNVDVELIRHGAIS